jgi:DNA-binding SARP family transcriptional activator
MKRHDADPSGWENLPGEASLHLLGSWALLIKGVPAQASSPAQKMLALLALRGPASRAAVAGTLWPEVAETVAFGRLRTVLWRLAGIRWVVDSRLGDLLLAASVSVDVHRMYDSARRVLGGAWDARGPEVFEKDLLPQWYDDWLIIDRERIRQTRLHALETLSALLLAQGRHAKAVDAALAAVRADPLRESAHRAVIQAHLAEGNVSEAIRQFRACRSVLRLELGVEPTPALSSLLPTSVLDSGRR